MRGDYSRSGFDPLRDYGSVLLQQGRPLSDRDVNHLAKATSRRADAGVLDLGGELVIARPTPDAFKITSDGAGGLLIGAGRAYVDGMLADNHGAGDLAWEPALAEQRALL